MECSLFGFSTKLRCVVTVQEAKQRIESLRAKYAMSDRIHRADGFDAALAERRTAWLAERAKGIWSPMPVGLFRKLQMEDDKPGFERAAMPDGVCETR